MIYLNKESKNTGKFKILSVVLVAMLIVLSACQPTVQPPLYQPQSTLPEMARGLVYGKKLYLTSIGQALDIETLASSMNTLQDISYTMDNLLNASEVEEGSVVFITVGCSFKALTESGLTKESEGERAQQFIDRADRGEITLVSWHIGGIARRGATSDSLVEMLFKQSDLVLFTEAGNRDLFLSDWAIAGGVPYCQFTTSISDVLQYLTESN